MTRIKSLYIILGCSLLILATAIAQYFYPQVSFFDYGFILAIFLSVFLREGAYTRIFGSITFVLIIIAAFYEHGNVPTQQVVTRHTLSAIFIGLTTLAVWYIKKLNRSLEADQQQVKALFEHATEGMVLTNKKGEIVLVNPAATSLFGYEMGELLGQTIETLIPMRFHDAHVNYRKGFYQHPSNRTMGHGRDLFAKRKDGTEFPVEVSLSFYQQKNEFYVIAFIVDITSRKKSEQELLDQKTQLERVSEDLRKLNTELEVKVDQRTVILREALQELEKSQAELNEALNKEKELNEIKSRFVSMASHEFRTPLSTVLSSAALISKYKELNEGEKMDKHIKRIKDSVKHLNELLEDFLSLGKLEEGKIKPKVEQFDLKEHIEELVEEMRSVVKQQQIIHLSYEGEALFTSDKGLIKNILINLISNAIKFSPENGQIWLNICNEPGKLGLTVKDEGIGISKEDQQHLFSSFYRAKNVVNIEGTGLGLHIVKRYVELLLGTLELQSEINRGTIISIVLPELNETTIHG